ncbi:hypothetical protein [Caulobacter sp. DWR1-3-2b1]|uniref:hypothetical protein n=1 Tax=Caulobacter sp. DWR1-3-2b1 TaxID=2804670 RepID=UPI003CF7D8B3
MAQPRKTRPAAGRTGKPLQPAEATPPLEWASAAVGLALALTAFGFVAHDAVFGEDTPPVIEVRLLGVTATPHGYVAEVRAINHGGTPAAQVQIEGVLEGASEPSQATFDYIPEESSATGGLVFDTDPRQGKLTLRAKGYVDAS